MSVESITIFSFDLDFAFTVLHYAALLYVDLVALNKVNNVALLLSPLEDPSTSSTSSFPSFAIHNLLSNDEVVSLEKVLLNLKP